MPRSTASLSLNGVRDDFDWRSEKEPHRDSHAGLAAGEAVALSLCTVCDSYTCECTCSACRAVGVTLFDGRCDRCDRTCRGCSMVQRSINDISDDGRCSRCFVAKMAEVA